MEPIRIVLVDDHISVAQTTQVFLESFPDLRVVGIAPSAEEALQQLAAWQPHVVVMDLFLPGGIDGIAATAELRVRFSKVQVVVRTAYPNEARVQGALRAGALGVMQKHGEAALIVTAVREVASGRRWIDPSLTSLAAAALAGDVGSPLTKQEQAVLRHLARGRLSNKEIGQALGIGEETVKTHVGRILAKCGLESRSEVPWYAFTHGLITPGELDEQ